MKENGKKQQKKTGRPFVRRLLCISVLGFMTAIFMTGNVSSYFIADDSVTSIFTRAEVEVVDEPPTLIVEAPASTDPEAPICADSTAYVVSGWAWDDILLAGVTVNGEAVAVNAEKAWSKNITLRSGVMTTVEVVAWDSAGNTVAEIRYVVSPKAVSIDSSNRVYAGYQGSEQETLTIPTLFQDGEGLWCKPIGIQSSAFANCTELIGVELPDTIRYINSYAFRSSGLKKIHIPGSVEKIGNFAFYDCADMTEMVMDYGVVSIGHDAFALSGLTTVSLPESVTTLRYRAFNDCDDLLTASVPSSITEVEENMFAGCNNLTEVYFPEGVITVGVDACMNCPALTYVYLPSTLTAVEDSAFRKCPALRQVYYAGSPEQWRSIVIGTNNDPLTDATITYNYIYNIVTSFFLKVWYDREEI